MSTTQSSIVELRDRLEEAAYLLDVLAEIFAHDETDNGKHVLTRRIQADIHAVSQSLQNITATNTDSHATSGA